LVAHFTTLEMQAAFVAYSRDLHIVYKTSKNQLVDAFMLRRRGRAAAGMISSHSIREMIKVLKRGGIVWYSPDQAYRGKGAEMVPFFGVPAATNVSTSRLARLTGAVVLPYFPERLPGAAGYRVRIGAPLEGIPSDDAVADTLRFTHLVEAHVRRVPEQYLWLHKRFKGLTPDYPDFYGSKPIDRATISAHAAANARAGGRDDEASRPDLDG
jgi:KDO2-lipid IV(A) lauroyltransferase